MGLSRLGLLVFSNVQGYASIFLRVGDSLFILLYFDISFGPALGKQSRRYLLIGLYPFATDFAHCCHFVVSLEGPMR